MYAPELAPIARSITESSRALSFSQIHHRLWGGPGSDADFVVLIHGVGSSSKTWSNMAERLSSLFRVITYDLRGHGQTADPGQGYTLDVLASDLKALLDGLDVRRAHLIGHSSGARLAMRFASLHPERVLSLVSEDVEVRSLKTLSVDRYLESRRVFDYMRSLRTHYEDLPALIDALTPGFAGDRGRAEYYASKMDTFRDEEGISLRFSIVIQECNLDGKLVDLSEVLSIYRGPVLFLRALPGTKYFPDDAVDFIKRSGARAAVVEIAGTGHTIHQQRPEEWYRSVESFLRRAD